MWMAPQTRNMMDAWYVAHMAFRVRENFAVDMANLFSSSLHSRTLESMSSSIYIAVPRE